MASSSSDEKTSHEKSQSTTHSHAEKEVLPLYKSPFSVNAEFESVHLRHQSNIIELFFDLFLAADLATFTAAHSITDRDSLIAYIGFFVIIWSTWFQITLHDVRFAQDSVYERLAKVLQFLVFVSFALVGADFSPEEDATEFESVTKRPDLNFWLLSFTLFLSRAILAIQYTIILFTPTRPTRLRLPLLLNVVVFLASGAIFIGFTDVFTRHGDQVDAGSSVAYITWYLVLLLESVATIAISYVWKEISFTSTHLTERMGLLTFIIIGEGAIGASKTTIEMMGRRPLALEPILLVIFIVLILVNLWALYFDNLSNGSHGSVWHAISHLPLHLSFVGILEGSRQVALMRFISQALRGFVNKVDKICLQRHLDGKMLGDALLRSIDKYDFGVLHPTADQYIQMREVIQEIASVPGVCSVMNTAKTASVFDPSPTVFSRFNELMFHFATALFISDGAEDILPEQSQDAFALLEQSFITVYLYYWVSVLAMLLTLLVLYRLNNSKSWRQYDVADYCSMGARCAMILLAIGLVALYEDKVVWTGFIESRAMLPTLCGMLAFIILVDRTGRELRRRSIRKKSISQRDGDTAVTATGEEQELSWLTEAERLYRQQTIASRRRGVFLTPRTSVYNWLIPNYNVRRN